MSHTPEPWRVEDGTDVVAFVDQYPSVIADCINHSSIGRKNAQANARRIVACVNACAGVPNEDLIGGSDKGINWILTASHVAKQRDELQQQRDKLLAASKHMLFLFDRGLPEVCIGRTACDDLREAIDSIESPTQEQ